MRLGWFGGVLLPGKNTGRGYKNRGDECYDGHALHAVYRSHFCLLGIVSRLFFPDLLRNAAPRRWSAEGDANLLAPTEARARFYPIPETYSLDFHSHPCSLNLLPQRIL